MTNNPDGIWYQIDYKPGVSNKVCLFFGRNAIESNAIKSVEREYYDHIEVIGDQDKKWKMKLAKEHYRSRTCKC